MSMTVSEATAVNTLLRYMLGIARPGYAAPDTGAAVNASRVLARSASKKLAAGLIEKDVADAWDRKLGRKKIEAKRMVSIQPIHRKSTPIHTHRCESCDDRYDCGNGPDCDLPDVHGHCSQACHELPRK